jgi:cold-inducible RNA-binding protein
MGLKLYVGNLPFTFGENDITQIFSNFGGVSSVRVIVDRDTGRSKGFGFVEMTTEEDAQNAIKNLNGSAVSGRNLTVNEARPMEDKGPRESHSFSNRDAKRY